MKQKNISLWSDVKQNNICPCLETNIKCDVLIVGGGLAGLLCAYYLNQAGIDYALVEGNRIASGISKNTAAKIIYCFDLADRNIILL